MDPLFSASFNVVAGAVMGAGMALLALAALGRLFDAIASYAEIWLAVRRAKARKARSAAAYH